MKDIKILGGGCAKCEKLEELAREAAGEKNLECNFSKVKDINEIMKFGVMVTPALVVDGTVKVSGRVPTKEEIKEML